LRDESLKVGLVGLGRMGQNHVRILSMLRGVDLAFVADADAALAARAGAAHGVPGIAAPGIPDGPLDAIVICTPTVTHADYIRLAAGRVKNIFVEKPLAATLQEAQEIAAFAQAQGLNLQVGFIERFNPAVQALRMVLEKSERVISVDFTRTNKVSARITDVDVVTDLMIHDIDLALHLNGPARSVFAHGYAQGSMIDFATALIAHESGRFSRIQASRVTDKKMRQIEATCSDMFVDCDLLRKEIIINRQSETRQGDVLPYTISAIQEAVAVPPQEALLTELQAFAAICRQPGSVAVPGVVAGVEAMRICAEIQAAVVR
jgi:predicted dehydrogenase